MANKMLKSLTIDGVTYDNLEYIGKYYNTGSQSIANGTQIKKDLYILPNDNSKIIVLGRAQAGYSNNPNGVRWLEQYVKINGSYSGGSGSRTNGLSGFQTMLSIPLIYTFEYAQGQQVALNLYQNSGSALTVTWSIDVFALRVGGVVRLLKSLINSICYRPQFGKAVA